KLVAPEAERLPALAEPGRDLGEHAITDRMAVAVVDLLEVVDVEQAESQRDAVHLSLVQITLQALVEVAVVTQTCERVRESEAHCLERAVHRALVERDRHERADQGDREQRRALP